MKVGPKYKIAKRLGASVFEKTQSQKFAIAQERRAPVRRGRGRGPTEYGRQLLEKQKVRITYGLTERKFSDYVRQSMAHKSSKDTTPAEMLHRLIETRLDNVVYRLGLAPTRFASRQMVSHGHITVNGRKTTVPSREIRVGDVISVREGSRKRALFDNFEERAAERRLASWLEFDAKKLSGGITQLPTTESAEPAGDLSAVLSFYSR
jgi:small subunit ribosomal protein S4